LRFVDPDGLEPYSEDFWPAYLNYITYTSTDVWNKIGGSLGKTYGPYSNSCAARVSYGPPHQAAAPPRKPTKPPEATPPPARN
jgi:hypothetical protein